LDPHWNFAKKKKTRKPYKRKNKPEKKIVLDGIRRPEKRGTNEQNKKGRDT